MRLECLQEMGITEADFRKQFRARQVGLMNRIESYKTFKRITRLIFKEKERYKEVGGEKKRAYMKAAVSKN